MLIITKDNIIAYLKEHMEGFDPAAVTEITMIGEGTAEDDGDGYVNYIFRIHTTQGNYVLKQGRETARVSGEVMDIRRNQLEYDSMRIRRAITPEYVPKPYFCDPENNLFVMEDVSCLKVARFQFNQNVSFEDFGKLCGDFIARSEFYTSEFYLSREEFRGLRIKFENTELRKIMEDGLFLDRFWEESYDASLGPAFEEFAEQFSCDRAYITELYKLRRKYITHTDALIHADLHTSNLFASDHALKVTDMEFTFMGPFGFDLGYLTANLISQYCAAAFKPFDSEEARRIYKTYMLATIKSLYQTYFAVFTRCWEQDVKERYIGKDAFLQSIFAETLEDSMGYASMGNWFRVVSEMEYPDFDVIENPEKRRLAKTLSLLIDWQIMFNRYQYTSVDDFIDTILYVEKAFMKMLPVGSGIS